MIALKPLPPLPVARPEAPQFAPRDAKAWAAAQAFESFFLGQVMNAMSAGLKTDGPFDAVLFIVFILVKSFLPPDERFDNIVIPLA